MPNAPRKDGKKISDNADMFSYKSVQIIFLNCVCSFLLRYEQIFRHCNVYTVVIGHALK